MCRFILQQESCSVYVIINNECCNYSIMHLWKKLNKKFLKNSNTTKGLKRYSTLITKTKEILSLFLNKHFYKKINFYHYNNQEIFSLLKILFLFIQVKKDNKNAKKIGWNFPISFNWYSSKNYFYIFKWIFIYKKIKQNINYLKSLRLCQSCDVRKIQNNHFWHLINKKN